MKNLTISLPEAVLERLRVMAAKRNKSLDQSVGEVLDEVAHGANVDWHASHAALYDQIRGLRSSVDWMRVELY